VFGLRLMLLMVSLKLLGYLYFFFFFYHDVISRCPYTILECTSMLRLVKRLKREKGMLLTFLEKECDWNNNAAERAICLSVVVRKVTYGNKSLDGAKAHAVLMTIKETCRLRGESFYDYALKYLGGSDSKR
jgi:hypothetical protein